MPTTAWEVIFALKIVTGNLLCISQAFPEALFHQLLLAMLHPDNKTRIGSHRVLSTIVAPSLLCPWSAMSFPIPVKNNDLQNLRLLALSAFSSESIMNEIGTQNKIQESLQKNDKSEAILGAGNGCTRTESNARQYLGSPCLNEHHLTAFNDEVWNPAGICILPCSLCFFNYFWHCMLVSNWCIVLFSSIQAEYEVHEAEHPPDCSSSFIYLESSISGG